tara:strand:- start:1251 stop:1427 length:177 start_codon:yes stop_codon:yes gene_type:complete
MDLAKKILNELAIPKPQRKFLLTLFTTILTLRNLSRYSGLSARTYSSPKSDVRSHVLI